MRQREGKRQVILPKVRNVRSSTYLILVGQGSENALTYTARILGAAARLAAEDTPDTDSLLQPEEGRTGNQDCQAAGDRSPGAGIHLAAAAAVVGRTGDSDALDLDSLGILMTAGIVLARGPGEGIAHKVHGDRVDHEGRGRQGVAVLQFSEYTFYARQPSLFHHFINYRVTHHVRQNIPLTSKQKFRFGLARPAHARPKRNSCFDVNRRF